jgi:hypothetical protein
MQPKTPYALTLLYELGTIPIILYNHSLRFLKMVYRDEKEVRLTLKRERERK